MSHSQVPYDPLLDQTLQHPSPHGGGTPQITAQDLDDPVVYQATSSHPHGLQSQPSNPNMYTGNMAGVGLSGNNSTDFGPPVPHFLGATGTRNSTYSASSQADRQSGYGSIAALRDSSYHDSPSGPQAGYAYPPGATPPIGAGGAYKDDPSGASGGHRDMSEKQELYEAPRAKTKRKGLLWAAICCGLVVIVVAVAVPVYFFVIKPKSGGSSSGSSGGGGGSSGGNNSNGGSTSTGGNSQQVITTGGDGSIVTKSDGTTFVYNNTLGGYWVYDVNSPLNNSAQAQSYTPPLSQPWKFGQDRIYG